MVNLFIYGTLQDSNLLEDVAGKVTTNDMDILDSHVVVKHTLFPYPTIQAQTNGVVFGRVIDVSYSQLSKLDSYESILYEKVTVTTRSGVECLAYIESRCITTDILSKNVKDTVDSIDKFEFEEELT